MPGDSLTGGAGTDVLALYGSGTFQVDQLATFTGFESITLNNFTSGGATLYLGSQSIAVTGYGSGTEQVYLGSGAVTFQGGSGSNDVFSTSASNWNAGNSIDGGSYRHTLYLNWNGSDNAALRSDDEHAEPHQYSVRLRYKSDGEDQQCCCWWRCEFLWDRDQRPNW